MLGAQTPKYRAKLFLYIDVQMRHLAMWCYVFNFFCLFQFFQIVLLHCNKRPHARARDWADNCDRVMSKPN